VVNVLEIETRLIFIYHGARMEFSQLPEESSLSRIPELRNPKKSSGVGGIRCELFRSKILIESLGRVSRFTPCCKLSMLFCGEIASFVAIRGYNYYDPW
jgi:hypothetical protein